MREARRTIGRKHRLLGLLAALAFVAAACGGETETPPTGAPTTETTGGQMTSAPPEVVTVRVSVAPFGSQLFPVEVIERRGLDEKYGIEIERVPLSGPPAHLLQITGDQSDIAAVTWLELQQNLARGIRVIGVGPLLRYTNPLVVQPDSDIQGPEDLKGRNIGVYFLGGTDVLAVRAAIQKQYGFDLFEENTVSQADAVLLGEQLGRGDLDAIFTFSNLATQLESQGKGKILFEAIDVLKEPLGLTDDDPFGIYMTSANVVNNHPERVERFLAAYKEAVEIMLTEDEIWVELAETQNITDEAGIAALRDIERRGFSTVWDQSVIDRFQLMFDILQDIGGTDITGVEEFDASVYTTQYWPGS